MTLVTLDIAALHFRGCAAVLRPNFGPAAMDDRAGKSVTKENGNALRSGRAILALFFMLVFLEGSLAACQTQPGQGEDKLMSGSDSLVTLSGERVTMGDGVECPELRTADGEVHRVSYLAPDIAIGDRVSVTGFFAPITTCRGLVLVVQEVERLNK